MANGPLVTETSLSVVTKPPCAGSWEEGQLQCQRELGVLVQIEHPTSPAVVRVEGERQVVDDDEDQIKTSTQTGVEDQDEEETATEVGLTSVGAAATGRDQVIEQVPDNARAARRSRRVPTGAPSLRRTEPRRERGKTWQGATGRSTWGARSARRSTSRQHVEPARKPPQARETLADYC